MRKWTRRGVMEIMKQCSVCPGLEASQQNVESRVAIPGFLSWLTLEIVDEVVYSPSSSEYFDRLKVRPQCFQVLHSSESIARPSSRSISLPALLAGATRVLDTQRRTRLSCCLKSAPSNDGTTSPRPSPPCRGSLLMVSPGESHWFDQGERRRQSCLVHEYT